MNSDQNQAQHQEQTVSISTLIRSSLAALAVAVIALITLILPAEYNIDPTGVGQLLGLTVLAHPTETLPAIKPDKHKDSVEADKLYSEDLIEVTVPPNQGIEYKLQMTQYSKVEYEWLTDGKPLYVDLHGEPEGDTTNYFESYAIATLPTMKGSFIAPFDGSHGWYWKNSGAEPVTIQLMLNGQYEVIGLKQ